MSGGVGAGRPGSRFAGFALVALALACLAGDCSRGGSRLNVLLVTLDTTRADHLHCYGYRNIETPHLDRLAREGILFENAATQAPLTLPAHSSIMTGLTPPAHGVRDNGKFRLGDGATTMAEILKSQGYDTAAMIGAYVLHSSFGLDQGFDVYDEDLSKGKMDDAFHYLERPAEQVSAAAMKWLDGRRSKKPFFMWVHYFDAHAEYKAPSPYAERYAAMPYDGEIAYVDGQLGRLLEELEKRGLWDRTLVVVVGDHGESLGEHGEETHGNLAYDSTLRVPFIMSHPDSRREKPPARWKPRKVAAQVQQIDILPTVAALTGTALPGPVEGASLLPLLDGEAVPDRPCYAETLFPYYAYGWASIRTVRFGGMKYIWAPTPELYDLKKDPRELVNLAPRHPDLVERYDKILHDVVAAAASHAVKAGEATLTDEERQKLVSLGYLQTGSKNTAGKELDPAELKRKDPKDLAHALSDYLQSGMGSLTQENFTEAEEHFRAFLNADPDCGEGHCYLGLALRSQGRWDEALAEFRLAEKLAPDNPKPPLFIGVTLSLTGHEAESRPWLEKAVAMEPLSSEPLVALAYLDEMQGNLKEALAGYDKALSLDSASAASHLFRGALLRKMGREEDAQKALKSAADLVPRNPLPLQRFARQLAEMGHPELARPLFEQLVKSSPEVAEGHAGLANCFLLDGDYAKAVNEYVTAIRLAPDVAQYQYLLGCAYGGMGRLQEARAAWERTLQLNPAHAEARHNLELLQSGAVSPQTLSAPGALPGKPGAAGSMKRWSDLFGAGE